jgi:hypothetical protein
VAVYSYLSEGMKIHNLPVQFIAEISLPDEWKLSECT